LKKDFIILLCEILGEEMVAADRIKKHPALQEEDIKDSLEEEGIRHTSLENLWAD